jgi:hypothetical protein
MSWQRHNKKERDKRGQDLHSEQNISLTGAAPGENSSRFNSAPIEFHRQEEKYVG